MIALQNEKQIAEIILRIREYQGMTGAELAAKTYVDRRTVKGRDTGQQGYTLAALMNTARALGYTVALIPLDQAEELAA